ncbi:MAG: amidohydrolase family protein, partial [Clostridia bacterium]|nr:amidohydrolase family protein [Clostridia bacterium]
MLDLLIKNGTVIDGTGKPAWSGNIGIKDGKIVFAASDADAARVIDATGKIVSPGFIDAHSHGDGPLGTESGRLFKTPQGVTTEICGNCGGTRLAVYNDGNPIVENADFGTFARMLDYA